MKGLVLTAIWSLIIFAVGLVESRAEQLILNFDFPVPILSQSGGYTRVRMTGIPNQFRMSKPLLPSFPVRFLVPAAKKVTRIEAYPSPAQTILLPSLLEPAPAAIPLSFSGSLAPVLPDPAVYQSANIYPEKVSSKFKLEKKCGFTLCSLDLYPVRFQPQPGFLAYYPQIKLEIELKGARTSKEPFIRGLKSDRDKVKKMVINPEIIDSYPCEIVGRTLNHYPYLVITSPLLTSSFNSLIDRRASRFNSATVIETEWIYGNFPGRDAPEKIRNFLRDAYLNWGTEYVLLGGDSSIIPPRMLYVEAPDNGALSGEWAVLTTIMPADLYYSNLDGSFNSDSDGLWGEPQDGDDGGDIDLLSELAVGRFPVASSGEVDALVAKTLKYEDEVSPWVYRAAMIGEYLGFGGVSDYARSTQEEVRLGSSAHGYTTQGFASSSAFSSDLVLYDHDFDPLRWVRDPELLDLLDQGVGLINHLGHGSTYGAWRLNSSQVESLTNSRPFFGFTQACNCGGFDYPDCWAEVMTTTPNGALGIIANARYGFGYPNSTDGPSQRYAREFWDALLSEGINSLGGMLADARDDLAVRIDEDNMRWCFYELNLMGDPAELVRFADVPIPTPSPVGFYTPVPTPELTPSPTVSPTPNRGMSWMGMSDVSSIQLSYTGSSSQVGWQVVVSREDESPLARTYDYNGAFWRDYDYNNEFGPVAVWFRRNNSDPSYPDPLEISVSFESGTAVIYLPSFSTSLRNTCFWVGKGTEVDGYYYCPTFYDRWLYESARPVPSATCLATATPIATPTATATPVDFSTPSPPPIPSSTPSSRPTVANTYYVDGANPCSDDSFSGIYPNWEGQSDGPWKTLNHAVSQLGAGNVCWVRATSYFEKVSAMSSSGLSGQKIVLQGDYRGEIWPDSLSRPVVDGQGDRGYCIDQFSGDYWTYRNLELKNPGWESDDGCFRVRDPHHHITLENCLLHGGTSALLLNYRTHHTVVRDCLLYDSGYGVRMKLNTPDVVSVRFERSRIFHNSRGIGALSGGYYSAEVDLSAVLISNNKLEGVFGHFSAFTACNLTVAGNGRFGYYNLHSDARSESIHNTIVCSNNGGVRTRSSVWSGDYNDVWGNGYDYEDGAFPGIHSFSVDPIFWNPSGGDYRIRDFSVCNEAGSSAFAPITDLGGSLYLDPPSLGCWENQNPVCPSPSPTPTPVGFKTPVPNPICSSSPTPLSPFPSSTPVITATPSPTPLMCAQFFCCTEVENARLKNTRGDSDLSWYYSLGFTDGDIPGRGYLLDSGNNYFSGVARSGGLALRLVLNQAPFFAVESGDQLNLAYDGGREFTVYLPQVSGVESLVLYVREDGATCYDPWLCLLACGTPTSTPTPTVAPTPLYLVVAGDDYNGDGTTDAALYRPTDGVWFIRGVTEGLIWGGGSGDIPVPGDYNGDGTTEPAIFSKGSWQVFGVTTGLKWGQEGDLPVPGDYDGDGTTNFAYWRPTQGRWHILGFPRSYKWGLVGDIPVPGDYDGDGMTDMALWRPQSSFWFVRNVYRVRWGVEDDYPLPLDYDGDGAEDLGIWRPQVARWFVKLAVGAGRFSWGEHSDLPLTGDFEGDGWVDPALYRKSSGEWLIRQMPGAVETSFTYGTTGAIPVSGLGHAQ